MLLFHNRISSVDWSFKIMLLLSVHSVPYTAWTATFHTFIACLWGKLPHHCLKTLTHRQAQEMLSARGNLFLIDEATLQWVNKWAPDSGLGKYSGQTWGVIHMGTEGPLNQIMDFSLSHSIIKFGQHSPSS